eukprot:10097627-Lingulodinium_polyedra.AAC.1
MEKLKNSPFKTISAIVPRNSSSSTTSTTWPTTSARQAFLGSVRQVMLLNAVPEAILFSPVHRE